MNTFSRTLILLWMATLCLPGTIPAQRIPLDGYAASVNDRVITVSDVLTAVQGQEQQVRLQFSGSEMEEKLGELYDEGLQKLVERALILEEFELSEAEIPAEMVDRQVQSIIEDRFGNNRSAFLMALKEQQMSREEWRETVAERLAVMVMRRREVEQHVVVSPTAVLAEYEKNIEEYTEPAQVLLRMIVLQKGDTEDEQAVKQEEAHRIVKNVVGGEDFAALARAVSEGGRASRGGEWDWIEPGKLRRELREAVEGVPPGQHTDVVEAGNELYIIKVEGRKAARVTPFAEVKNEIEDELRGRQRDRIYEEWMDRLRSRHYVKRFRRDGSA